MKRLLLAASFLAGSLLPAAAIADSPQHLVDSATLALQDIMQSSAGNTVGVYLRQARAIVVCPNIFRGGLFIVGGEGGGCLMLARTSDGNWSNPAFYSLGSASFGPQIGVQSAEVMMLVMTSGGLNALLNSQFKFGADADIITFSKTQGLYGGVSLQGSILSNDSGTEQQYYGTALDARQIVLNLDGSNPGANPLRETLTHFGR